MIGYVEVVPLLTAACPTYSGSIHAAGAEEDEGEYLTVGRVVAHLIELLGRDDHECLLSVFGVVEWVLEEGDDEARALLTEGFFDDLTNPDFYTTSPNDPRAFVPWLGPRAREQPSVQPLL
jgi:hypothetical protein